MDSHLYQTGYEVDDPGRRSLRCNLLSPTLLGWCQAGARLFLVEPSHHPHLILGFLGLDTCVVARSWGLRSGTMRIVQKGHLQHSICPGSNRPVASHGCALSVLHESMLRPQQSCSPCHPSFRSLLEGNNRLYGHPLAQKAQKEPTTVSHLVAGPRCFSVSSSLPHPRSQACSLSTSHTHSFPYPHHAAT